MASFHLDHLKNYHRRFCRPSGASNIHTKKGENMLKILEDCFEEQDSTESLTTSTPKEKVSYSQSAGKACQASHSKSVPESSRNKETFLQVSAESSEAAGGSVKANDVYQKSLSTDAVSKSTPQSNKMSSKKIPGQRGASDELYSSVGSPMVLRDANVLVSPKTVPSAGLQRVASVTRSSGCMQSSNTDFSFKTKKRLNFEDEVISNTGAIENNALQIEDDTSKGQEGTSLEITQNRDYLSSEVQPQSKKSFSELYLETVKRKSKSSSVVRHTAAAPPPSSPPNDMKLLEDEFIIDRSDRSFSSQPWVTIPKKGRHLSHHVPSPENIAVSPGKKSEEKPHSLAKLTFISNTQSDKACPIEEAQLSVEENLGTNWTYELENDCRSTENKMQSENAKKPSTWKRTKKQKQRRELNLKVAEELHMGQSKSGNRNMSTICQDKLQISSKRNTEDCEEVRNEPIPKKHMSALGSVDGNSSKENESSVVYPKRKKRTKRNHVSENTGKKPCPSKRQKTQISSTVQRSLNVKGSSGTVSGQGNISSSQRKPLKNIEADSTQKSLHISGPSRFKNCKMPDISSSEVGDGKDQESLDLTRSSNMVPDRNLHHKLVLPSTSPGVRRSKRVRLKPLEYWRGERVDYQESSSGGHTFEIISPTLASATIKAKRNLGKASQRVTKKSIRPENCKRGHTFEIISPTLASATIKAKRSLGKVNQRVTKKSIRPENCKKKKMELSLDIRLGDPFQATLAKDLETGEIVPMDLIRPRDTYHFFVEQHGLKVFKILDTTFFSTGKLILGPHEEKGTQHVGQDILVFYVNFGDLLCTLHQTPYMITTGDSFYVPSGNHYNIKNLLNVESCLLFTQIKSPSASWERMTRRDGDV
ncbi:centromere protein C isoform X2 [Apodemus sylvaticus]|uniref:centromere protein C isoform X2 n=1 Tax=Apodemus sylvaticus TaxID=10129 RepID=UPI002242638E|nr:centromere protein C isoform X2 [Apodemus sylvaticus]